MAVGDLLQIFGGAGAGVVGVCVVIVVLFVTGQISTKKQMDDRDALYAKQLESAEARSDEWKKAYELERARGDASDATGRIVRDVMLGLRQASKELE